MCTKFPTLTLFQKRQFLGCYNSTPLKMNLILEIRKTSTKIWEYSILGFFFTFSCSSIVLIKNHFTCIPVALTPSNLPN